MTGFDCLDKFYENAFDLSSMILFFVLDFIEIFSILIQFPSYQFAMTGNLELGKLD